MKVHRFIYFMLVVFLLSTISACTSKLPKDVEDILANHYSYTTYSIVSYQKAPHPENYPGFAGTTEPKDEVWCIVVQTPEYGYSGVVAHRLGRNWSTGGPNYQMTFEQLGCTNLSITLIYVSF